MIELATRAPSVHNTQPWRFQAGPGALDLYADRTRQLAHLDPTGRQLTISCGAALLFARVALAAAGVAHHVELMPNHDDFDLLARILLAGDQEAGPDETLLARTIPRRSTVRGIFDERRVPARLRDRLAADAASEGAWLRWIDSPPERAVTAVLVTRATRVEEADPAYRAELRRWRRDGGPDGVPAAALPYPPPRQRASDAPLRDFEPDNVDATRQPRHGEQPDLVVVGTDFDGPAGWLEAGQATARILLRLTAAGAAASPLGQVLDLPWTREQLRLRLGLLGHPQMLLRLGYAPAGGPGTPRRPVEDVLADQVAEARAGSTQDARPDRSPHVRAGLAPNARTDPVRPGAGNRSASVLT